MKDPRTPDLGAAMHEPGTTTEDINQIRHPPPAAADPKELRVRRFGRRCLYGGIGGAFFTFLACLSAAIIADRMIFHTRPAQLFAILSILTMLTTSASAIILGGMERLHRPVRARQRLGAVELDRIRVLVERLTHESDERYRNLAGLVTVLPGRMEELARTVNERLTGIEASIEKVPAVSDAFLAGMTLRTKVEDDERS